MIVIDHNPFTWFSTESDADRDAKHAEILRERTEDGVAYWDWINFDNFYTTAIRKVAEYYAAGNITQSEALDAAFKKIDHGIMRGVELNAAIEALHYRYPEATDLEREGEQVQAEVVRVFFSEALPALPFAEGDYNPAPVSREDIIAEDDLALIGSHMQYVFLKGIDLFLEGANGYPAHLTVETWNDILKQIKDAVAAIGPDKKMGGADLDLLTENYTALWD